MKPASQASPQVLSPFSILPVTQLMHLPVPVPKHTAQETSPHAVHLNSPGFIVTSWNVDSGQSAEQIVCEAVVLESSLKDFSQRVQLLASEHSRQYDGQSMLIDATIAVPTGTILTQIWPVGLSAAGININVLLQVSQAKLDVQVSQPKTHLSQVLVTVLAKNFGPQPVAATQVNVSSSATNLRGVSVSQVVH